jgi:hypothetical protein
VRTYFSSGFALSLAPQHRVSHALSPIGEPWPWQFHVQVSSCTSHFRPPLGERQPLMQGLQLCSPYRAAKNMEETRSIASIKESVFPRREISRSNAAASINPALFNTSSYPPMQLCRIQPYNLPAELYEICLEGDWTRRLYQAPAVLYFLLVNGFLPLIFLHWRLLRCSVSSRLTSMVSGRALPPRRRMELFLEPDVGDILKLVHRF